VLDREYSQSGASKSECRIWLAGRECFKTHSFLVAGRKPTISMASWSLSKSCFRSSPSTAKQSYATHTHTLD